MGTADVVSENLETGHGVSLGLVAEHQVPHLLVGIGLMGTLLDLDEAGEDGPRGVGERIMVEQVACRTRSVVILESPLVDLTLPGGRIDGKHDAPRSLTEKMTIALAADIGATKIHLESRGGGILGHFGRVDVEGRRLIAPLLDTRIGELGSLTEGQVVYGDRESGLVAGRSKPVDDRGRGTLTQHDQCMGENRGVLSLDPMPNLDGLL